MWSQTPIDTYAPSSPMPVGWINMQTTREELPTKFLRAAIGSDDND